MVIANMYTMCSSSKYPYPSTEGHGTLRGREAERGKFPKGRGVQIQCRLSFPVGLKFDRMHTIVHYYIKSFDPDLVNIPMNNVQ